MTVLFSTFAKENHILYHAFGVYERVVSLTSPHFYSFETKFSLVMFSYACSQFLPNIPLSLPTLQICCVFPYLQVFYNYFFGLKFYIQIPSKTNLSFLKPFFSLLPQYLPSLTIANHTINFGVHTGGNLLLIKIELDFFLTWNIRISAQLMWSLSYSNFYLVIQI